MSKIRDLVMLIGAEVQAGTGYGFFPGGDPRNFTPDEDSSEEERAKHKADCEAWDKGEKGNSENMSGKTFLDEKGKMVGHVQPSGYGLGIYTFVDPWVQEIFNLAQDAQKEYEVLLPIGNPKKEGE